uniref:Uncharacterized protein n=1 Tax=Balaenoptera musculus TaxID=9771 RepID=A0A8C0D7A9_BALMU
MCLYGLNVCFSDHLRGHLVGNVYVKFWHEEDAAQGVAELNNHWFNSQTVHAKLSPVTDFWEPCCRQMGECTYGEKNGREEKEDVSPLNLLEVT